MYAVAQRQIIFYLFQLSSNFICGIIGRACIDIALHFNRRLQIAPPDYTVLCPITDFRHLLQRYITVLSQINRQIADFIKFIPVVVFKTHYNINRSVACIKLRRRCSRYFRIKRLRHSLTGYAHGAQFVLVKFEMNRFCFFLPVKIDIIDITVAAHYISHLTGYFLNLVRIIARYTEHHRIIGRRSHFNQFYVRLDFRKLFVQRLRQFFTQIFPGIYIFGRNYELCIIVFRQNRFKLQNETRRALSRVIGEIIYFIALFI